MTLQKGERDDSYQEETSPLEYSEQALPDVKSDCPPSPMKIYLS